MAIEFIIEDGTGKTDSTSYTSVAEFKQFWENRGVDYSATTDVTIQTWLNKATEYTELKYKFRGSATNKDQALFWPRSGVLNKKKTAYFDTDEIPDDLKKATNYLAGQLSTNPDFFSEVQELKSLRYGPVAKTFSGTTTVRAFSQATSYISYMILNEQLERVN